MEEGWNKFIDFAKYCPKCEYYDLEEMDDPCNECLTCPARTDGSRKPINFKERE